MHLAPVEISILCLEQCASNNRAWGKDCESRRRKALNRSKIETKECQVQHTHSNQFSSNAQVET